MKDLTDVAECRICHALVARETFADHSEWHRAIGQWPPSLWNERPTRPLFARRMEIHDAVDYFERYGLSACEHSGSDEHAQKIGHNLDVLLRAAKDYLL
ncbi:hypothetical protein [uncultured Thermomonospora sp.]|uniref:hypothetical protein n=1 Tax=uncultured Thermomonospora sp. TaxID=671175 RepID=UPI00259B004A|nr:hypothetical protein [uncultured Thermomonospora sp.]